MRMGWNRNGVENGVLKVGTHETYRVRNGTNGTKFVPAMSYTHCSVDCMSGKTRYISTDR